MRILQLIDNHDYVCTNSWQSQLAIGLDRLNLVRRVTLDDVKNGLNKHLISECDVVLSTIKFRNVMRDRDAIAKYLGGSPVYLYDQDPHEFHTDDSPYKGAYPLVTGALNVKKYFVTSKWWADRLNDHGMPTSFVRMWPLPEHCVVGPVFAARRNPLGFMGLMHPYRASLFAYLSSRGYEVPDLGRWPFNGFFERLLNVGIFVYSDQKTFLSDGEELPLGNGLWGKAVEVASHGCFVIRNRGADWSSYLEKVKTTFLYDSVEEVPGIIDSILSMDEDERKKLVIESVDHIRTCDYWSDVTVALGAA